MNSRDSTVAFNLPDAEVIELTIIPEVIYNTENNEYTIYDSNNKGGAIMSDKNKEIALMKFEEASHLAIAIRNLLSIQNKENKWYKANIVL